MPNVPTGTSGNSANTEEAVPALSWPPETFEASGDEDSLMGLTNNGYDLIKFNKHHFIILI